MITVSRRWPTVTAIALVACLLPGCGPVDSGGDKAGGDRHVSLRLASAAYAPGENTSHFIKVLEAMSHGDLTVVTANAFGGYAPDAEIQVVRAVATGDADLGWVGSRTFDSLGVLSLEALSAPLLIGSYAVENAVLASPLADQLLAGVGSAGVTGLGISAGDFQLPIGVSHPLVTPADWHGVTFGTYASVVQEQAIRALGAIPFEAFGDLRRHALETHELEGFHLGLPFYGSSDLPSKAPYVTVNVRLWAQSDVSFVNPDALARLSRQQREWLFAAAADTKLYAARVGADEGTAIRAACAQGARMVKATPNQLAALRTSLQVVYDVLEKNPQVRQNIAQIRRLASVTTAEAASPVPSGCAWPR